MEADLGDSSMTEEEEYRERMERHQDSIDAMLLAYYSVRLKPNLFDTLMEEARRDDA